MYIYISQLLAYLFLATCICIPHVVHETEFLCECIRVRPIDFLGLLVETGARNTRAANAASRMWYTKLSKYIYVYVYRCICIYVYTCMYIYVASEAIG